MKSARALAAGLNSELSEWLRQEYKRVIGSHSALDIPAPWHGSDDAEMAHRVLTNCWLEGKRRQLESVYAPYSVLHRAPLRIYSGRDELLAHYDAWRRVMPDAKISIDHVCGQPFGTDGRYIAVRWGVAGTQQDAFAGCEASGQPLFILGVTHWRVLGGRIISEWTVFDELALMAQSLSRNG